MPSANATILDFVVLWLRLRSIFIGTTNTFVSKRQTPKMLNAVSPFLIGLLSVPTAAFVGRSTFVRNTAHYGTSSELNIPCTDECALEKYPNLPDSIHPGVLSGQAQLDLLNHAKENGRLAPILYVEAIQDSPTIFSLMPMLLTQNHFARDRLRDSSCQLRK